MSNRIFARQMVFVCLCSLLLSLLPASPARAAAPLQDDPPRPAAGGPGPATARSQDDMGIVRLTLAGSGAVAPGGVAALTLESVATRDAPAMDFVWLLPDGGELLGGPAQESIAPAARDTPYRSERQVRFAAEGRYRVMASAGIEPDAASRFAPSAVLFFDVRSDGSASLSLNDPAPADPRAERMATEVIKNDVAAAAPDDPDAIAQPHDPCFNVSGQVKRIEKRPIQIGLNNLGPNTPVANAVISMREEDTLFDDTYGTHLTDANGRYSFSFCDDDGVFDDELELYVRLRAELKSGGFTVVEVEDSSYIDEVYEFDSQIIESEGGNYTINFTLSDQQSGIFNIADAVWQAWSFWNDSGGAVGDDAIFGESAEVHWEAGYGDAGSYYSSVWGEITVADGPADPDQWDDGVIMHEWGHMADDEYGCDDNGGGEHFIDSLADDAELAWGEGYPDYYQSAVRQARGYTDPSFYFDTNSMGLPGIRVDLEQYDSTRGDNLLSEMNELAIAAMLWDLNEAAMDGRTRGGNPVTAPYDRVNMGHAPIQRVYTDPTFESNGDIFDDACTSFVYLDSWRKMGLPTDGPTAEAVVKNINRTNPFNVPGGGTAAQAAQGQVQAAAVAGAPTGAETAQWWKRFSMVVDTSASMAGPKIAGVKEVAREQANGIATDPKGTQIALYTFDNTSPAIVPRFTNYFTGPDAAPRIDALGTSGAADPTCQTYGLDSLAQAARDMRNGQAWLYTDGDSYLAPSVPALKRMLNERQVRGSVVLLVGCGSAPNAMPNRSGSEQAYLGLASNSTQPSGIVPYLLTALGSGGQFLYVNQSQLASAGAVLRAQLAHTAGAGRWSDYVSDDFTYIWDKLEGNEFQWFPIDLSQDAGSFATYRDITLPGPFSYWGSNRNVARVYEDGYIRWDPCSGPLCPIFSVAYNNILYGNLDWAYISPPPALAAAGDPEAAQVNAPDAPTAECYFGSNYGYQVKLYTANFGIDEWFIITTVGEANYGGGNTPCRGYQIWINRQTGEIRYQYQQVAGEAGAAEIGLLQTYNLVAIPDDEVIVSKNQIAGASNGMGYKFTPAPPQPTRTHTVTVDSLIESVAFLQTGFSGNFEPMIVRDPSGTPVNCADTANVLCLTVDNSPGDRNVQYVQANVNGRTGVWSAVIDAGSSRKATYSFTGMAASAIEVEGAYDHQRASFKAGPLLVKLARGVDGNQLTGWMQKTNGARWGAEFTLFDDGAHGDGQAGDGQFGNPDFTPPGRGVGYLWVRGAIGGQNFQRMDPAPINFQPFELRSLNLPVLPNDGSPMQLYFSLENQDNVQHCFMPSFDAPPGWFVEWNLDTGYPCLNPGQTFNDYVTVYPNWSPVAAADAGQANADTTGAIGTIGVSAQALDDDSISDSASTSLQLFGPVSKLFFEEEKLPEYLRANGADTTPVGVRVLDNQGFPVADGTQVDLTASIGTLADATLYTVQGRIATTYTAPAAPGSALLTAVAGGYVATTTLPIAAPTPSQITLTAAPMAVGDAKTSALTATVLDDWGSPVAGATVRIGVEGDGQMGTVTGGEVFVAKTNTAGQVKTTFTKVQGAVGFVNVRAELMTSASPSAAVALEATVRLDLTGTRFIYLPLVAGER